MPECVARGVYQCTGCDRLYGSSLAALACEDDHVDERDHRGRERET